MASYKQGDRRKINHTFLIINMMDIKIVEEQQASFKQIIIIFL
jgi:hypothetical protein